MDHRRREKKERKEKKQHLRAQALATAADNALGGRELRAQTLANAANNALTGRELLRDDEAVFVTLQALIDAELDNLIRRQAALDAAFSSHFHIRTYPAVSKQQPHGLDALSHKFIKLTPDQHAGQGEIVVTRDFAWTFGCSPCVGFCLHVANENSESMAIAGHIDPTSDGFNISELLETIIPSTATVRFAIFGGKQGCDAFIGMVLCQLHTLKCKSSTNVVQAIDVETSMAVDAHGTFYHANPIPDIPDIVERVNQLLARLERDGCIATQLIDRRN